MNETRDGGLGARAQAALALVAVLAAALPVQAQQPGSGGAEPPVLPVGRDELVRIQDRPNAHVLEYVIGPVRIDSGVAELRAPIQMTDLPIDGWLHGFDVSLRDADGNLLPIETLHQLTFLDPDQRELFSPIPRRVLGASPDAARQRLPGLFGYPVLAADRLLIEAVFANPTGADIPEAFLHVALDYSLEGEKLIEPRNVYPFHLDVMGPVGEKRFVVPPGRSRRAWTGSPAVPGRILALGGHVHDYATRLRLVNATDGSVVWEVQPNRDREGRVEDVPRREMWWRLGHHVYPEKLYRIEVEYDNPLDVPAPSTGAGVIGGVILVEKGIAWPRLERTDPAYAADLEHTLSAPRRAVPVEPAP